jgi:hypothetical protein
VTGARLGQARGLLSFADLRKDLERHDTSALELAAEISHELPTGHQKSIVRTLLQSIDRLGAEGRDFLRLASVLAVAPIPPELVRAVFQQTDHLSEDVAVKVAATALGQADDLSLCEKREGTEGLRAVHTLVSRAVRFRDPQPQRTKALRAAAVKALAAEIAKAAADIRLHRGIEFHIPHAREVMSTVTTEAESTLVSWTALYDLKRAAYASAKTLYERCLEFRRRVQGPEHPDTLASMGHLAMTLYAQGDLVGARKLQEDTLAAHHRLLGPEDPSTLASMGNLAATLLAQGDLAGARKLQEDQLALCRRVLGPEHANTLTSMNNLADMLQAQGDLAGARKLGEETLAVQRRALGSEHPNTLTSMNNLAGTLKPQGDLAGARKLAEEALAAFRRALGNEHPNTLTSMNNLAGTLKEQGDLAGARKLAEETLAISGRVLGPEHPETLSSMSGLAVTLLAQGDLAAARKLQEEVLGARRRALGPEHPSTLASMANLAATLAEQGDLAGARKLQEETLAVHRRVLGPEHPSTLASMNNLAAMLLAQGDLAGGRKLQEETLEIHGRVLGPEHPHTSMSAYNLLTTLAALRDWDAVQPVLHRDLLWLLQRDPAALSADECKIRGYVAELLKRYRSPKDNASLWERTFGNLARSLKFGIVAFIWMEGGHFFFKSAFMRRFPLAVSVACFIVLTAALLVIPVILMAARSTADAGPRGRFPPPGT